jgi:hypothetical protein
VRVPDLQTDLINDKRQRNVLRIALDVGIPSDSVYFVSATTPLDPRIPRFDELLDQIGPGCFARRDTAAERPVMRIKRLSR